MRLASTATAATIAALSCLAHAAPPDDLSISSAPPVVVKTVPEAGSVDVDPKIKEVTITFSKEMTDGSYSIVNFSPGNAPKLAGKPRYADDKKTCILPVSLEPGRCYAVWLNTVRFQNFKDADARPALPYLLVFETKPAN
jgi:Bacterial Ig-like domain